MGDAVGLTGLGAMGLPMTRVLAAAAELLLVYDISAQARQRMAVIDTAAMTATRWRVRNDCRQTAAGALNASCR